MNIELFLQNIISKMMEKISPENLMKRSKHLWKKYIPKEVSVIAVGKSSVPMLRGIIEEGYRIKRGIVVTTKEFGHMAKNFENVEVFVSSHPIPNEISLKAAQRAMDILRKEDFVLFLISGGGSSLMEYPAIDFDEYIGIVKKAIYSGLDIHRLNALRRYLSRIKGGKILREAKSKVISLILSDVPGNYLEDIASGLTFYETKEYDYVKRIAERIGLDLDKYSLPKPVTQEEFRNFKVRNFVIGGIYSSTKSLKKIFSQMNIPCRILGNRFCGEAKELGKFVGSLSHLAGEVIILGGEWEVRIDGPSGIGGPNLELVLSSFLTKDENSVIVSLGTDGVDGNSPAAGGFAFGKKDVEEIVEYLNAHNSYEFMKKIGGTIETGPTGTNLADVCFLIPSNIIRSGIPL